MTSMAPRFRGRAFSFIGTTAAQRRLESMRRQDGSHLVVGKCVMVRVSPPVWKAETSDGMRWVSRTADGVWVVAKVAPVEVCRRVEVSVRVPRIDVRVTVGGPLRKE